MIPNDDRQPYHLELTDGVSTVGLILCDRDGNENPRAFNRAPIPRSSLKIYQGEQKNSDLEPPWTDVVQEDWGGGHGGETFDDDASRYWDGYRMDSTRGYLVRGPLERFAKGVRGWDGDWNSGYALRRLYGDRGTVTGTMVSGLYQAVKFTATTTATHVWLYLGYFGAPGNLTVSIFTDNAGTPGVLVNSATTITTASAEAYSPKVVRAAINVTLTPTTAYWIVINGASATSDSSNYWYSFGGEGILPSKGGGDGATWDDTGTRGFMFRLTDAEDPFRAHFGILKNSLYAGLEYLDGGDSVVYINGTAGTATAGATTYLRDTNNAAITDDAFNGALIYLWDGPGSSVYRRIADTATANSEITVTDWGITPTAATKYAVLDTEKFTLAGTFATATSKIITDVLSANGALYWAAGDAATAYIRRLRHHWTAGAPGTYFNWTDEGTSGTLLESLTDGGAQKMWLANRSLPTVLKYCTAPDCTGTDAVAAPTWTTATAPGDVGIKATNIVTYGEGFPRIHLMKEDAIIEYVGNQPQELRIAALRNARDGWNGIAACVNDVYLYFSFLDRVQRYYSGQIDDIGPDLPADRRGKIMALVPYPGRLYAAVDGGPYNYSTIQCYNGRGWCEVYRAPSVGLRIMNAFIQPIPGPYNADRLWFSMGSDIVSLSIEVKADPAGQSSTYYQYARYAPAGWIESGWMYLNLRQIEKLFNSVTLMRDSSALLTDTARVLVKYDEDTAWTYVGHVSTWGARGITGMPVAKFVLDDTTHNETGMRIRVRIVLEGLTDNGSSKIVASALEGLVTVPHKYQTTITFRLEDYAETLQLNGQDTYTDADTKFAKLDEWASLAGTVGLTSHIDMMNNKRVKIDAASVQLLKHEKFEINGRKRNRYLCQMSMIEVD